LKRSLFSSFFVVLLLASAALAQSVSITSPASGSTVGSPMQVVATANGGSYPVSAMRVYVDNQSMYSANASSLNTSVPLATGKHYLVVVGWNTKGTSFSSSMYVNVGTASIPIATSPTPTPTVPISTGVSVSAPTSGVAVGSPVHFLASAGATSGRSITAMRVYVDYNSVYLTNSGALDTYVSLAAGNHVAVVQAWDSAGTVYKSGNITVSVGSSSTSGSTSTATTSSTGTSSGGVATSGTNYNNFKATSNWLATLFQPDGALLYGRPLPTTINPYMSNIAAIALAKDGARLGQVQAWMKWVIAHLNYNDKWGMSGTIYDWNIDANGNEASTGDADSTDSYAATFMSLAWNLWKSGDANSQAYLKSISYQLDLIGGVLAQTMQGDGLTWAKPDYLIKYTMDNCEVYRGLKDLADLFNAMGDTTKGSYYASLASQNLNGINTLWMSNQGLWAVYKDWYGNDMAPNMGTWYADATAQLFPVLEQVIPASDSRMQTAYAKFNAAWPGWASLSFQSQDEFPWCLVGAAAKLMGDNTRATQYLNTITTKYVNPGFVWTMFNAEGGWYMRTQYVYMGGQF
jgi:hypothetical protein